ncbi:hypothetical protein [Amycolatopsis sp. PS_44_ISF1]|uniref:hypothetical protein n=1 Tax=Amycolatopsis sp. PS_44_ISF1 TaxID=2974917 RepID=UPI0028E0112F|nr:hypothetical protein [Amycolatopsis sp. PS_44_ISF1]MDT8910305.1 hypothetical protein [Amycolatopsis sp. PS_44_ISF1]
MATLDALPRPDDDRRTEDPEAVSRERRPLVLATVAGFVLGLCVLGLLWTLSGQRGGANDDALAACQSLHRAGRLPDTTGGYSAAAFTRISDDSRHRVTAAYELAQAAADSDGRYQPLAQSLGTVNQMVQASRYDSVAGQSAIITVQQLCARG